ncbi:WAT1-related protein At3g28050 [Linum perenne]
MELNSYVSSIRSSSRIIGYAGLYYSSPLLSSAIGNLNPAFTFMLALIFRMEKVAVTRKSSQAKVVGTIVSTAGAFIITLYKGQPIVFVVTQPRSSSTKLVHPATAQNWVLGSILLTLQYILGSLWSILLVHASFTQLINSQSPQFSAGWLVGW